MKCRNGCSKELRGHTTYEGLYIMYTGDGGRLIALRFRGFRHTNLNWGHNTIYETNTIPSARQLEILGVGVQCEKMGMQIPC